MHHMCLTELKCFYYLHFTCNLLHIKPISFRFTCITAVIECWSASENNSL